MTEEIFPMKEMGDYFNPKYICIKANAEKGEEGPAIKEKFGIKAYPTFVILNNDGNLIHMFAGGVLGLEFIDKVEESFNPELAFGELQKRYNAGERSKKLTSSYLQALQHTYTTNVGPLIEEFANSLSDDELICEECLFLFDEHARLGSSREKFLTQHVEKFREVVGQDKVDQILNRKYEAYYCGILGKQMAATTTDVEQVNKQLEALHLTGVTSLPLYQAAVATYLTKEGGEALFEMIKKVSSSRRRGARRSEGVSLKPSGAQKLQMQAEPSFSAKSAPIFRQARGKVGDGHRRAVRRGLQGGGAALQQNADLAGVVARQKQDVALFVAAHRRRKAAQQPGETLRRDVREQGRGRQQGIVFFHGRLLSAQRR